MLNRTTEAKQSLPNQSVVSVDVNLHLYPQRDTAHPADFRNQLTIGDLHGNALKLIYFLIRQNVLEITERDYVDILHIYYKKAEILTTADIKRFNEILSQATVNPCTVRLIGDELADRGSNDYFTLKVLETLFKKNVDTEILLSNHSFYFLKGFSGTGEPNYNAAYRLGKKQAASLVNLGILANNPAIDQTEFGNLREIVDSCYKPTLRAISYSVDRNLNPPKISIFTHAPVGLETIKAMADFYDIVFDDSHLDSLCETIDEINAYVAGDIVSGQIHKYYADQNARCEQLGTGTISTDYPLLRLLWNRASYGGDPKINQYNLPVEKNGYKLTFIHGHDGYGHPVNSALKNMVNLDNLLGRPDGEPPLLYSGNYTIFCNRETSSPRVIPQFKKQKKRSFSEENPLFLGFLKWVVIPLVISAIVLLSGGLAFIPLSAGVAFAVAAAAISVVGNGANEFRKTLCTPQTDIENDPANAPLLPTRQPSMNTSMRNIMGTVGVSLADRKETKVAEPVRVNNPAVAPNSVVNQPSAVMSLRMRNN